MNKYDHKKIESKWQKKWREEKLYRTEEDRKKKKFYTLDMFPYPSGAGLHVGHPKGYIATDITARMKAMRGYSVLHPMGWDAFGLPAENYAIKNKIHPRAAVEENIKKFKKQLEKIGFTYDWEREINTTDPEYYRWTQWIFLKMFEKGLAYQSYEPINWCPGCQTGLANEDLEDNKCERCGSEVEKRPMRQWVLKMTAYADRLLEDLKLLDWDESIIEQQRNWIGRSEGALVKFQIQNSKSQINSKSKIQNTEHFLEVFTTRPDTLFGCTYMVVCPEHEIIKNLEPGIENLGEVKKYIAESKKKSDLDRTDLAKEKTGVELKGIKAINPTNNEEVPIWVADYVLAGYGTGAIMAVPAHDERDFEFAKKYGLEIKQVVKDFIKQTEAQKQTLKSYNDKVDEYFEKTISEITGEFKGLLDYILSLVNKNSVILEVGSGTGKDADYMESLGYKIERTDDSTGFVKYQKSKGKSIGTLDLISDEIDHLKYDLIFANAVLLHFDEQQTKLILKKISDGLKKDGILAFSVRAGKGEEITDRKIGANRYFKYWSIDEIKKILGELSFENIRIEHWKDNRGVIFIWVVVRKIDKTKTPEQSAEDFGEPEDSHPRRRVQSCHSNNSIGDNKNVVKGRNSAEPAEGLEPSDHRMTTLGLCHTAGSSTPDILYQNNKVSVKKEAYAEEGVNINSDFLDGLETKEAKRKMIEWLEENNCGKKSVNYKMRDWVFSRQRYWGEPIPLIFCEKCKKLVENHKSKIPNPKQIQNSKFKIQNYEFNLGEILNPGWIADKNLPLELPEVKNYEPTGTGESPLANIEEWVNTTCPKCGGAAKRETNTMPQWAGSSWYYLRYLDSKNNKKLVDKEKEKYWMEPDGVDLYVGGAEHATRHLLYARFWHKFLYDIGAVSTLEPFHKLFYVGLILAADGRKMSKRWGNVINPDEIVEKYGADSLRLYEMFMGPFSQATAWNTNGLIGMSRFLEKAWEVKSKVQISNTKSISNDKYQNSKIERLLHKTIKKVTDDIESFKFNTAVSQLMILVNEMEKQEKISSIHYSQFLILLSPFAPHIAEELWEKLGNKESVYLQSWPKYNLELIKEEEIELIVQINGKLRDRIKVAADITEEDARKLVLESDKIKKWIEGKEIRKFIFVGGKLVNIVIGN